MIGKKRKKTIKIGDNNLRGIFLDADDERLIIIELPLVREKVTMPNGETIERQFGEIIQMGDFHYGHEEFSRSVLNGYLNYLVENKHIKIGLMGDYVNYAEVSRHLADEKMDIDEQITNFCADFRPFKDRIIFILSGNHDERWAKATKSYKFLRYLALELGVDPKKIDSGEFIIGKPQRGLWIVYKVGDKYYGTYVHHGSTAARINRKLQLTRMGSSNQVCMVSHGHTHELSWGERRTFRSLEFIDGQVKNTVRRQWLVSTGCFLKHPSYAEAHSYPYTDVGAPIIRFYADNSEIEVRDLTSHYKEYTSRGGLQFKKRILNPLSEKIRNILPKITKPSQIIRPPCPRCSGHDIISRGIQWHCKTCGRYWKK